MEYLELTSREAAYNLFGQLNTRLDDIRRYRFGFNQADKVDLDDIASRIFRIDPAITLPLVEGILESINNVLGNQDDFLEKIKVALMQTAEIFKLTTAKKSKKDDSEVIKEILVQELNHYKTWLLDMQDRLELINISSINQEVGKLQWDISIELLSDILKVLREQRSIIEENQGDLTSFVFRNFSSRKSKNISRKNLQNNLSGKVNNLTELKSFLSKLIRTASTFGEKS
jgi:hypothetical protein